MGCLPFYKYCKRIFLEEAVVAVSVRWLTDSAQIMAPLNPSECWLKYVNKA